MEAYYVAGVPVSGDYLMHYRTPGSKNGVRRFQNEDGSLTPLGRRHYGVGLGLKQPSVVTSYSDTGTGGNRYQYGMKKIANSYSGQGATTAGSGAARGIRNKGSLKYRAQNAARGVRSSVNELRDTVNWRTGLAKTNAKVGYLAGRHNLSSGLASGTAGRVGYAAGRAVRGANQAYENARDTAGKMVRNTQTGYEAGKRGWQYNPSTVSGKAGYVAGRITRGATKAAENVGRAANTVKEWGSQQLNKAKDFISNLFSSMRAGKAAFNVGAQGHETRGGNAAVKVGNLLGRAVSALKQAAPKALQAGQTFMETVFEAVGRARDEAKSGYTTGSKGTYANYKSTAAKAGYAVGKAVNSVKQATRKSTVDRMRSDGVDMPTLSKDRVQGQEEHVFRNRVKAVPSPVDNGKSYVRAFGRSRDTNRSIPYSLFNNPVSPRRTRKRSTGSGRK